MAGEFWGRETKTASAIWPQAGGGRRAAGLLLPNFFGVFWGRPALRVSGPLLEDRRARARAEHRKPSAPAPDAEGRRFKAAGGGPSRGSCPPSSPPPSSSFPLAQSSSSSSPGRGTAGRIQRHRRACVCCVITSFRLGGRKSDKQRRVSFDDVEEFVPLRPRPTARDPWPDASRLTFRPDAPGPGFPGTTAGGRRRPARRPHGPKP